MSQGYDDIKEALMKSIYLTRSQIYTSLFSPLKTSYQYREPKTQQKLYKLHYF